MTYARSALTHATALFLVSVTLFFFGGLYLNGGAVPFGPAKGWGGLAAPASPIEVGLVLAALCLSGGMIIAFWQPASWGESTALLAVLIGLYVLSSGTERQAIELLEALSRLWKDAARWQAEAGNVGW